jgi:hypothetical protein
VEPSSLIGVLGYAIYSYKHVKQLSRLVSVLASHDATAAIAVHHDATGPPLASDTRHTPKVTITQRIPVHWGHWSQVAAIGIALRAVIANPRAEWVVLLSAQDYPVRPLTDLAAHLHDSPVDGYMDVRRLTAPLRSSVFRQRRYLYRYYPAPFAAVRLAEHLYPITSAHWPLNHNDRPAVGLYSFRAHRSLPRLWTSSEWFMLRRSAVELLLSAISDRRSVGAFRRSVIPTEAFFATILMRSCVPLCFNNFRYMEFPVNAANPRLLDAQDVEAIRHSGSFFARKFDFERTPALMTYYDQVALSLPSPGRDPGVF